MTHEVFFIPVKALCCMLCGEPAVAAVTAPKFGAGTCRKHIHAVGRIAAVHIRERRAV